MIGFSLIKGDNFTDHRGSLRFFNTLDMSAVKRMYEISPVDTNAIRAWQGHEKENKWFFCTAGIFIINLIEIDNFINPSKELVAKKIVLNAEEPLVLKITGRYVSGIKAVGLNSKLLVFSNFTTQQSKEDDFRFEPDYWSANWDYN